MCRRTETGLSFSPLYLHVFKHLQPHYLDDSEFVNITCPSPPNTDSVAEKLLWYRLHSGLLQREVAKYVGLTQRTYAKYEDGSMGYYDISKLTAMAELFNIHVTELLDDYNNFLFMGQGGQIKNLRKNIGLTQIEYAKKLNVPIGTLKQWEHNRVRIFKSTWEKLFKNDLHSF